MRILSLGAGVQSSTLALMAATGAIEPPDYAIFADTGWEPKAVYDWLDILEQKLTYPLLRVSRGNLRNDVIAASKKPKPFVKIPMHVPGMGLGRRQCTADYKVLPIQKTARKLAGFQPRQRIPIGYVKMLLGISTDEYARVKESTTRWVENVYPLIDLGMSRNDCLSWLRERGFPTPPKSACIGCAYHGNAQWHDMKTNHPEEFADACQFESEINSTLKITRYLHKSKVPLAAVDFRVDKNINHFINECEGLCGV